MKAETWLPIMTLVLGWAGAQVTEVFRDRRTNNRERLVRQAELQRTTLLELQDALLELFNHAGTTLAGRFYAVENPESEKARELASGARGNVFEAQGRVMMLTSRVLDAKAREDVDLFIDSTGNALRSVEKQARQTIISDLSHAYSHATDRLGELIRERY